MYAVSSRLHSCLLVVLQQLPDAFQSGHDFKSSFVTESGDSVLAAVMVVASALGALAVGLGWLLPVGPSLV